MDARIKVLLVDDEPRFRTTTARILGRRGIETALAASGADAIAALPLHPDVIVLDIRMPGMDGLAALEEIRKRSPDVPVIMLTGHGSEFAAKEALAHGAFDFLAKPCDIDLLVTKIREASAHRASGERPAERRVGDAMIPREDYTAVSETDTVGEAIRRLRESFTSHTSSESVMETGHRSVLVTDAAGRVKGILAIADLLRALMPGYLTAPRPSTADTIQYSPLFWTGMFTRAAETLRDVEVADVMSPSPPRVEVDAPLLEAAYLMVQGAARRLLVVREGEVVGVIREQDLFFEMDRILGG